MVQFLEFLAQQWILVGALLVCVGMLIYHEQRKGGPSVTPQQLINLVNQQQGVVVDLRDPAEFRKGHIVDAMNIPFAKLAERQSELESYRERPLILVCKIGQHAGAASKQLRALGFSQVNRLGGGLAEWQSMQLPLVK